MIFRVLRTFHDLLVANLYELEEGGNGRRRERWRRRVGFCE